MSKAGLSILEEGLANFAKFYLEAGRERYEAGDKSQLLHCLDFCLRSDPPVPVPPWLREAFHDAYHAGASYQIKSWDEVFGRPLKKGGQLASERRKYLAKAELFETIYLSGKPLDDSLFALVGKKFGFSSTVAKELYYQALGEMRAAGLINPKKKTSGKNKNKPEGSRRVLRWVAKSSAKT